VCVQRLSVDEPDELNASFAGLVPRDHIHVVDLLVGEFVGRRLVAETAVEVQGADTSGG
jgi:hypothetical protein